MMLHRASLSMPESSARSGPRLVKVPRDFPSIQQAFDAARSGDGVFIAPGRYVLDSPLMITRAIHVIAVDEVGQSAELTFSTDLGHLSALRVDAGPDTSVRIKGLRLEFHQKHAATPAIQLSSGSVILDECSVTGCAGISIAQDCYATLTCVKCVCAGGCGVRVLGKAFLDRCELVQCAVGATTGGDGRITLRGTLFRDCKRGLVATGACNVAASSTAFTCCDVGASLDVNLHAGNGKAPEIKGCEFVDCKTGIEIAGQEAGCGIYKNYLHGCTVAAIRVLNATERLEVTANAIKQCPGDGIVIVKGCPVIESNTLEEIGGAGFVVGGGRPIIRLNEVVRCTAKVTQAMGLLVAPCSDEDAGQSLASDLPLSSVLLANHRLPQRSTSPTQQSQIASDSQQSPLRIAHEELLQVDPNLQPDPLYEMNMMGENRVNITVIKGVGTYHKNDLLPTAEENVYVEGAIGRFAASFRSNDILGSAAADGVVAGPGARIRVLQNTITECRISGVVLHAGCAAAEITGNTISKCQVAVTVMQHAHGRIAGNTLRGLQILFKGDSAATVLASDNTE